MAKVSTKKRVVGSAKYKIERFPSVSSSEMAWFKRTGVPGKLFKATAVRGPHGLIRRRPGNRECSVTHTHISPYKYKGRPWQSLPSPADFKLMIDDSLQSNIKSWHIANLNKEGQLMGYTHLRLTKEAGDESLRSIQSRVISNIMFERGVERIGKLMRKLIKQLNKDSLLIVHFIPMKGFKHDSKKYRFVKT